MVLQALIVKERNGLFLYYTSFSTNPENLLQCSIEFSPKALKDLRFSLPFNGFCSNGKYVIGSFC